MRFKSRGEEMYPSPFELMENRDEFQAFTGEHVF